VEQPQHIGGVNPQPTPIILKKKKRLWATKGSLFMSTKGGVFRRFPWENFRSGGKGQNILPEGGKRKWEESWKGQSYLPVIVINILDGKREEAFGRKDFVKGC